MKNKTYWQSRLTSVDDEAYAKSEKYIADVRKQYQKAISNMEKDIAVWYQRVADNNEISYSAARKLLKANELEEFKWTVEDYIKAGQENAFDQRWMKELENASARVHISRLEAMKLQLRQHAEQLAAQLNVGLTDLLGDVYENQFYRNAFEISRAFGVGSDLGRINTRRIDTVLKTPWVRDGKVFSERIWADRDKLANELHEVLSQGTIRGTSPQKMARDLAKRMDVSRVQAERLILTETAAISAQSKYDTYKELGVEEFQISVTLDSRTCETCRPLDGLHFPLSQYVIGETVPPFHPRCRCSTVPYIDDEFTEDEMRAARDANDQGYELVPANMTYQEWEERFVGDRNKTGLASAAKVAKNAVKAAYADITGSWYPDAKPDSHVVQDLQSYTVNGATYTVDGHNVVLDYSSHEKEIAELLEKKIGGELFMVPRVNNPQGVSTPDYLFHGKPYDLKTITGKGKKILYDRISRKADQSHNFIFDLSGSPLADEAIRQQIEYIYGSDHTRFVDEIVVIKNGAIVMVTKKT